MPTSFYDQPILNSPYSPPSRHHALDDDGQSLDLPPMDGRRRSKLITPVPRAEKRGKKAEQASFVLPDATGLSTAEQECNPTPTINEIRGHVAAWRALPNPDQWGVTPATKRLLLHWRHHEFTGVRPFLCHVEVAETCMWLAEFARDKKAYASIWAYVIATIGPAWRITAVGRDMAGGTAP